MCLLGSRALGKVTADLAQVILCSYLFSYKLLLLLHLLFLSSFYFRSERKLPRFICLIIIVKIPGVRQKQSNCHSDDCSKQQALHAMLSASSLFLALGSGILVSTLTQMIQRKT